MKDKSLFTTNLNAEALKQLKPSVTQTEIRRLSEKYKELLRGYRSRGNPFLPELVKLKGNNGESANIEKKFCYNQPNKIILNVSFALLLTKKEQKRWIKTALDFFSSQIISSTEIIREGQSPKRISKRPYHVFETIDDDLGAIKMYYKKYSDKEPWGTSNNSKRNKMFLKIPHYNDAPWGTSEVSKKKREYRRKRNSWMKNTYKKHLKKVCQDDAYISIGAELSTLPLEHFGEWPSKTRDINSGKWKPIGEDPRDLDFESIKSIIQKKVNFSV